MKPDEAIVLRAAWKASGVATLSGFVAKLVANGGNLELIEAQRDRMVDVSRLVAAASQGFRRVSSGCTKNAACAAIF